MTNSHDYSLPLHAAGIMLARRELNPVDSEFIQPGELADAVLAALIIREADEVYDLPWRRPVRGEQILGRPSILIEPEVAPLRRVHWRDFVLADYPCPGTWAGWLYCIRNTRRDAQAIALLADSVGQNARLPIVLTASLNSWKLWWRWRPWQADLIWVGAVIAGAILYVGG